MSWESVKVAVLIITLSLCSTTDCSTTKPRIVGGYKATKTYPFIVSIQIRGGHACGGSIINKRTVVTAAHCLANITSADLRVHAGESTLTFVDGYLFDVTAIHYHELWNDDTLDYDVGLVRVAVPFTFNHRVQPIKLAGPYDIVEPGTFATVLGWGFIDPQKIYLANHLREAYVPIVSQSICRRLLAITNRMLCAGYKSGGIDACQYDSGGPLVSNNKLIGIVSWGISCAKPNSPGVYTRITEVRPWIEGILLSKYNEIL